MKDKTNETTEILNKIFICSILILVVLSINTIILAINISSNGLNNNTNQSGNADYDVSNFKEVTASELKSNTKGENTVVYIGRESCGWCVEYIPVMNEAISQYGLEPLYIDIAKIIDFNANSITDQSSFDTMIGLETVSDLEGYMDEDFGATPMTLIMKDGKIVAAQTGYMELSDLSTFLESNGFEKK